MEFVSPEGLRLDGRRETELRRLKCELGTLTNANGSAVLEMGQTKASVTGLWCWQLDTGYRHTQNLVGQHSLIWPLRISTGGGSSVWPA